MNTSVRSITRLSLVVIILIATSGLLYYSSQKRLIKIKPTQDISQPAEPLAYVNRIAKYSFQYSSNEEVISVGGYEGPAEESDAILIVDRADNNIGLMSINVDIPPSGYPKNEMEALNKIVSYWSSSTSQYLSPELNKITGPIQTKVRLESQDGRSISAYRYEINWRNDTRYSEGGSGTEVWLIIIPVKVNWQSDPDRLDWLDDRYTFLWLKYDKKDEKRLQPMLDSFTLHANI